MTERRRIRMFSQAIWAWYARHKRTLPWRDLKVSNDTERAYRILVSEVMLQQTQVSRVKIVFKRFLDRFPHISDLAKASNKDVILAWRGLGYNSRALRLRDAADVIVTRSLVSRSSLEQPDNKQRATKIIFPMSMEELCTIPGVGPYTAAAIRNFAFGLETPCIDTNIRRILHRTFFGPENNDGSWKKSDKELLKVAEKVLDKKDAANWHAALMDFGSLVQTKNNPKWDICPLTAKGIMKTTKKNYESRIKNQLSPNSKFLIPNSKNEPGRFVGSRFIPNRIFRGKIVEALRDADRAWNLEQIGRHICIDWEPIHCAWLQQLLAKLTVDRLVESRGSRYRLYDT